MALRNKRPTNVVTLPVAFSARSLSHDRYAFRDMLVTAAAGDFEREYAAHLFGNLSDDLECSRRILKFAGEYLDTYGRQKPPPAQVIPFKARD
jgi:hypothetical protein